MTASDQPEKSVESHASSMSKLEEAELLDLIRETVTQLNAVGDRLEAYVHDRFPGALDEQ